MWEWPAAVLRGCDRRESLHLSGAWSVGQAGGLSGYLVCVAVWTFVGQSRGPWGSLEVCRAVWTSVGQSTRLRGSLNVCGSGWRSVGQSECLWGRLEVCGAV